MSLNVYSEIEYPLLQSAYYAALEFLKQPDNCTIEVNFADKAEIREINASTRKIDRSTDVLSFPTINNISIPVSPEKYPDDIDFESGEVMLGEIVICLEIASEQAQEYGHSLDREICYLAVHGMLHLFGYDHEKDDDKRLMREAEEAILEKVRLSRN